MTESRRRSFWGWGYEDEAIEPAHAEAIAGLLATRFGVEPPSVHPAPTLDNITLPAQRIRAPGALREIVSGDVHERASHTYGKSFRDKRISNHPPLW